MDFKRPREKPEKKLSTEIKKALESAGWEVHRLNVSAGTFSTPGWPDYYITHVRKGWRWVEIKIPGGGLEPSQCERFGRFARHGIGVWILEDVQDIKLLDGKPNWWQWAMRGKIR